MPWPNLVIQDLLDAQKRLPPRDPDAVPVYWANGEVAFEAPLAKVREFEMAGLVEAENVSQPNEPERFLFYVTLRAEYQARLAGILPWQYWTPDVKGE